MRQGELIALKASDVDYEGRLIHVQRTLSRGILKPPKNGRDRYVNISGQLAKVLYEMKRKGDEWQFQTSDGTMLDPSNLRKSFRKFMADAECGGSGSTICAIRSRRYRLKIISL